MADGESLRRVYLDVCALSRPFDDQTQARIRLETDAVQLILSNARQGKLHLITSAAHTVEIAAIDEAEERNTLERWLNELGHRPRVNLRKARQRAEELMRMKIGPADAAHIASAEQAEADFVTVDDRLLKQAQRGSLSVWAGTPLQYCEKENLK
ncbi:MAG TPA: PIN domain-containing protein [Anaerolineales bacterium]|nr:PIN domain-containing protein [Anaerolineales bacterium]